MDYGVALQQRHPRPGQVRHRGDPLRLRPADRPHRDVEGQRVHGPAQRHQPGRLHPAAGHDRRRRTRSTPPRRRWRRTSSSSTCGRRSSGSSHTNDGSVHVLPERPYKFCEDIFEGNLDCKTWDRGANQQEVVSNVTEQFRNYYAFNAYRRGRTSWQIDGYLSRLQERYFNRYSEAFQFFFFLSDYMNYDLGVDLFLASVDSLNAIAAILQTPEPGLHCPTATSPTVATFPVDDYGYIDHRPLPGRTAEARHPAAGREAVLHQLLRRLLLHVSRASARCCEKLQALSALTSTESRFFRVDELSDVAARSSINYYRLFRDEVVKLLSGVIRNDPSQYAATFGGSLDNPTYQPTPVVDLDTFGLVGNADAGVRAARIGPRPDAGQQEHPLLGAAVRPRPAREQLGLHARLPELPRHRHQGLRRRLHGRPRRRRSSSPTRRRESSSARRPTGTGAAPNIGKQLLDELNGIVGVRGTRGTIPLNLGVLHRRDGGSQLVHGQGGPGRRGGGDGSGEVRAARSRSTTTSTAWSATASTSSATSGCSGSCCCCRRSVFDAILFDNDGVLVDTEHLYFRANQEALAGVGIDLDAAAYVAAVPARRNGRLAPRARARTRSGRRRCAARRPRSALLRAGLGRGRRDPGRGRHRPGAGAPLPAGDRHQLRAGAVRAHARAHRAACSTSSWCSRRGTTRVRNRSPIPTCARSSGSAFRASAAWSSRTPNAGCARPRPPGLRCWVIPSALTAGGRFDAADAVLDDLAAAAARLL